MNDKIQQLVGEGRLKEACSIIKELISQKSDIGGLEVYYAHLLLCCSDWTEISSLLPKDTNFFKTSGWINSVAQGKPINANNEPIPWITYPAIDFLDSFVDPSWKVFEWGSGNSTLWWTNKVSRVYAIESDLNWFHEVQAKLPNNASVLHHTSEEEYTGAIDLFDDSYFDVIVIDGDFRNQCANRCIRKLNNNGIIIFDNTDGIQFNDGVLTLQSHGFYRLDFWGLIPSYLYKNCTSIFSRNLEFAKKSCLPSEHISSVGVSCWQAIENNAKSNVIMNLKPPCNLVYPPFKNGLYMEEYFSLYWKNISFPEKDRLVYLDIFWHNLFQDSGGNILGVMRDLTPLVLQKCEDAQKSGKIVFTLFQWDDGLLLQANKPENLIVFAIAGNSDPDLYIPLPLIVEDRENRLLSLPIIPLVQRSILCSFVGTITHDLRLRMYNSLKDIEGFQFYIKSTWSINVDEEMAQKFIDVSQSSRFGLAPRGYGPSSFRFFELMQLGVIPIYVHDHENGLPYTDVLDYRKFSVIIHIDEIQSLPDILNKISDEQYQEMLREMNKVHHWFTPQGICEYVQQCMTEILYCQDLLAEYQ